jgi:hypothetical protein
MGLLDDAIREHLELKRRRGADPDEVSRQEHEALGEPRRGEFAQPGAATAEPEVAQEPAQPAPAPDPEEPPTDAPGAYAAGDAPPEPATRAFADDSWLEDDAGPARPPDDEPPTEVTAPLAPPPDGAPRGDEDVLEETPEFLQETPEHDRLWFEQKPPRDFDFDK